MKFQYYNAASIPIVKCFLMFVISVVLLLSVAGAPCESTSKKNPRSAGFHVILDKTGELLGASENGQWVKSNNIPARITRYAFYQAYNRLGKIGMVRGSKPYGGAPPCPNQYSLNGRWPANMEIGIDASWNLIPRPVHLSGKSCYAAYRKTVADELVKQGIRHPQVHIDEVVVSDLDGNGVNTVLIAANRHCGGTARVVPGDYSIVIARQIVHGRVRTDILSVDAYPKASGFAAPETFQIAGTFDLLGDGRMEPVINWKYYEGEGTTVFSIHEGRANLILNSGCGA